MLCRHAEQMLTGLCSGLTQWCSVNLDRGTGDGRTLVGSHARIAQDHVDLVHADIKLLGNDLGKSGSDARAKIHVSMQRHHATVIPYR